VALPLTVAVWVKSFQSTSVRAPFDKPTSGGGTFLRHERVSEMEASF
jgi:hypothetical protein